MRGSGQIDLRQTNLTAIQILSLLSFLVFLYHKRVIYFFADCVGKKALSPEWFVHFALVVLFSSCVLAYISVKPVKIVRKIFAKCIQGGV